MGAVGGVPSDDDTPIPDHLVEIISSTKDGRDGQAQLGIPDDMSPVYNRQLEESVYRAEEFEKENAEREKQLEQMILDKEAEYRQLSSKEAVEKVTEEEKYLTHEMQQLEMQVEARTRSALEKKAQLQLKDNQIKEKEKEIKNAREKHNQYSVLKKETEALRKKLLENETQLKKLSGDQDVLDTTESKSFINSKNEQVSENAGLNDSQTKILSISKTPTLKVNPEQINTNLMHTTSLPAEVNSIQKGSGQKYNEGSGQGFPKITYFSGSEPVQKGETSFDILKYEVNCLKRDNFYAEHVIKQAIRRSLRGQAQGVSVPLGLMPLQMTTFQN